MKRITLILAFILTVSLLSASSIDSLIQSLGNLRGKPRVERLLEITWKLRNNRPDKAISYCQQAIDLADSLHDYANLAKAYSFMGVLYRNLGFYSIAFSYYKQGMKVAETYNIISQLGYAYNNLGNIYLYQKQPDLSIYYLKKADSVASINKNYDLKAYALQNIGRAFLIKNMPDSAVKYISQALRIRLDHKIVKKVPVTYKYLADAYKARGDYKLALKYYRKTADLADFTLDYDLYSDYSYNMADLYLKLNKPDSALYFAQMALKIAVENNTLYRQLKAHEILARVYEAKKDYFNAYKEATQALMIKDKLFNEEVLKSIRSIQFTEEATKKASQIELLKTNLKLEELRNRRNQLVIAIFVLIILAFIVLLSVIYHKNKQIKEFYSELEKSTQIVREQNQELEQKTRQLEEINKRLLQRDKVINESINYAKKIVFSIMAPEFMFESCQIIKDYFIINKPIEEIGGDFYYFNKFDDFIALIVADATGHGIPGAFLSIVSIAIFKDILYNVTSPDAADILEQFRRQIKKFLRQDESEVVLLADSVDISLALFFPDKGILNYAGARRPLYVFKGQEFIEIKGSRSTAGFSLREKPFESHKINMADIDRLYMFTDGITDILQNITGTRFGSYGWKNLLMSIQNYTLSGQKNIIEQTIKQWIENGRQTDDILIIGIELEKV